MANQENKPKITENTPSLRSQARGTPINADTIHLPVKSLGLHMADKSPNNLESQEAQEARKHQIKRCIEALIHATRCENQECAQPSCVKMKRILAHKKICNRNINGECPICKQFNALCSYHATDCKENNCAVPFCLNPKLNQGINKTFPQGARRVHVPQPIGPSRMVLLPNIPRMFNQTAPMARGLHRPVQMAGINHPFATIHPFAPNMPMLSVIHRPPPSVFDRPYPKILNTCFDEFVQQQLKPYIDIDAEKQNATSQTHGFNGDINKEWHDSIKPENRNDSMRKIIHAIFPKIHPVALLDKRMLNLASLARKIEGEVYEKAGSEAEYFSLLDAKIRGIKEELYKKRQELNANRKTAPTKPYDRPISKL